MLRPSLPSLLAPPGGFSLSVTYRRLLEPHSKASTLPDATRSSIPQYYLLFSVPSFPSITFSPAGFTANSEGQVTSRANLHVMLSGARKKRRRRDPPFGCSGLNPLSQLKMLRQPMAAGKALRAAQAPTSFLNLDLLSLHHQPAFHTSRSSISSSNPRSSPRLRTAPWRVCGTRLLYHPRSTAGPLLPPSILLLDGFQWLAGSLSFMPPSLPKTPPPARLKIYHDVSPGGRRQPPFCIIIKTTSKPSPWMPRAPIDTNMPPVLAPPSPPSPPDASRQLAVPLHSRRPGGRGNRPSLHLR